MKKLYKSISLQLLLMLCILNFTACQEFNIDSQPAGPLKIQIDALESYAALATSPSPIVFNISSNTPWTITSDQQWCVPNPAMSASSSLVSEVSVDIESNTTSETRIARLTIQAEGIEEQKVITITQASKEELVVIPFDGVVSSDGEEISFSIVSNKPWKVIPSTQFLEAVDKASGEGNADGEKEIIKIAVPANSGIRRSGMITVRTDFQEQSFTITQDGIIIELDKDQEGVSEDGIIGFAGLEREKVVKIQANVAWKVNVPKEYQDWIAAEALSDSELKITLQGNTRFVPRNGKVMLTTAALTPGFEDVALEISQDIQFKFSNASKFVVNEEDGSVKLSAVGYDITAMYKCKRGHYTFDFKDIHITEKGMIQFDISGSAAMCLYGLTTDATGNNYALKIAGTDTKFGVSPVILTLEEINTVRRVEIFIEDDPANEGM